MKAPKIFGLLKSYGYSNPKILDDGRVACIMPLLFTQAIIVGTPAEMESGWYSDRWCYHNRAAAADALEKWNGKGEPEGWHRHPSSGRRRPEGDPLQEYLNP